MFTLALLVTLQAASTSPIEAESERPPQKVAIVIFEGVELLDFPGPGEVFSSV